MGRTHPFPRPPILPHARSQRQELIAGPSLDQTKRADSFESALSFWLLREALFAGRAVLLGGHFFLFAFHAHLFQLALLGFDRRGNLLLDLRCRLFQLR